MRLVQLKWAAATSTLLAIAACGDEATIRDDRPNEPAAGTGGTMNNTAGTMTNGGTGSNMDDDVVMVPAQITEDTTWTADNTYILSQLTYVMNGAVLTIEPGTEVRGQTGSALVTTTEGRIEAQGTAEAPIVFTSSADPGQRRIGDWGGVVLLGNAPINVSGGTNQIEGIDPSESRSTYGGTDATHNCGTLNYVRIEFAGFEFGPDNELNGLTVGGCGSETQLDYIQVHLGDDDGMEFFGGTASVSHAVVSGAQDDSIDWDQGWTGSAQFIAIIQDEASAGDNGFESDNFEDSMDAEPRSNPLVSNITVIGSSTGADGLRLRHGTHGRIYNAIVTGWENGAAIQDGPGIAAAGTDLFINNSIFFNNGVDGGPQFETTDDFDNLAFFTDAARSNKTDDPQLGSTDFANPNLVPAAEGPAASGAWTPAGDGLDTSAMYIGAFEPGGENWAAGWTSFARD